MLAIRLFGAPQISFDQRPVTMTRRKSRALIYYVAAHATPLTRDHLLAFFWPDHERSTAQQNLRATLYGLRKIFGALLLTDDDTLALAPEVWVDTRAFEARLAPPSPELQPLKETLDFYRGDFLSGFTLPDLPEFDDWAMIERERYRRLAVGGLTRLSQLYEARQDYRAGLDTLDQALAFDPLQEDLQRLALRLHYLAGDRAGAIRRYESFRQLLADEMGVPPMDETRAIYDAIITDTLTPEIWPVPSPLTLGKGKPRLTPAVKALPFVGREAELQKLAELAAASKLVLIEGEPGIGKSRLMEQFIQTQPKSALILIGQARELESSLPYHPIIEALRGALAHCDWSTVRPNLKLPLVWQTEAARLLPELAPAGHDPAAVPQATDEIRLWEGVSQFVLALARQLSLVLALDDLHWADSSTLGLLNYLIRKAGQSSTPIFFVATTRPAEPRSALATFLATLTREGRLERLTLNRLSPTEITALARQLSPTQADPLADWLAQGSEGNPFILAELDRYARENNLFLPDGALNLASLPDAPIVPPTVYSLIQARLARLSEADWQVLNAAVAVGREFEFEVVAHAVALSDAAVLDSLDTLQALGLIQPITGSVYRFDHHLTMEVAFQEISEPRHRLFHRRVAEAMEAVYSQHRLDSMAGLLAQHYAEGGVPERAAKYAFRAGQLASDLAAWSEAVTFFEQALALSESFAEPAQRQPILAALGQVCLHASQFSRAAEVLRAALDLAKMGHSQVNEGVLYLNLSLALVLETRFDEVLALAEEISAANRPEYAANAAYLYGLALSHRGADLTGAIVYLQKAEALLRQPAEESQPAEGVVALYQIKFELGNALARRGDLPAAINHYRDALEITRSLEDEAMLRGHILFHNNLAYHLHLLGDPAAAEYARSGLSLAQEKGVLSLLPYLWSTLGEIALTQNDLPAAEQHFSEGLALAQQFSIPERIAGLTANLGLVAKQRGQRELAVDCLSSALAQADELNLPHLATQIHLWLIPLLPPAEARAHLAAARSVAEQAGYELLLAEVNRLEAEIIKPEG
ncbi:MAG: AAA family ATPase [Anaerolineae bacterium]|nr:AAA family ATPase [Anaerolineae bacterium]